jgi:3-carboxy-cis,cis-muconate cycloisomerase
MNLLDPLFGWDVTDKIFTDSVRVQRMLDFEAALARAEAKQNVIPNDAAAPIRHQCQVELFDLPALGEAAAHAGNLAIPLVKELTRLVARSNPEASGYVHWGATSQDVIDTGLVLQLRDVLGAIESDLRHLCETLAQLADEYRATPLPARTWMQQAVPTVFGLKVAGWLDALTRHLTRLQEVRNRVLVIQFGGAAGTLASLGADGLKVAQQLASELNLALPDLPWHSHRDRIVEVGTTLGLLVGTLGKIARDVSLQTQTEISEVFEPSGEGRGGSSTMPHKRNPVGCAVVLAAAERVPALVSGLLSAMPQEHERGLGGWHAEWETLPELIRLTGGALHHLVKMMDGLEVDTARMRENLNATEGLIFTEAVTMALGKHIGKPAAHKLLEEISRKVVSKKKPLRELLSANTEIMSHLSAAELDRLFDPLNYIGVSGKFIDRAIEASKTESQ